MDGIIDGDMHIHPRSLFGSQKHYGVHMYWDGSVCMKTLEKLQLFTLKVYPYVRNLPLIRVSIPALNLWPDQGKKDSERI